MRSIEMVMLKKRLLIAVLMEGSSNLLKKLEGALSRLSTKVWTLKLEWLLPGASYRLVTNC